MAAIEDEDYFLEALRREEQAAEQARLIEQSIALQQKMKERPDWWTEKDLLMDPFSPKPEGFLANDELLCRGTVWMMFGPGGSFKTFLMMYLLSRIGTGADFVGTPTRKGKCLFISEEMGRPAIKKRLGVLWSPEEIESRDGQIAYRFHDPDDPLDFFSRTDLSKRRLCAYIENSNDPAVVAIDSLVKVHTGDEKNNSHGAVVLNALADVAMKMNVALGVIHHTGKKNEFREGSERARGWSCIRDIVADMFLVDPINKEGAPPRSKASWTKTKDLGSPVPSFNFSLDRDPGNPERSVFTFDKSPAASGGAVKPEDMVLLTDVVLELAGADGEVLRGALRATMVERWKWGRNRFESCLSECVRTEVVGRQSRGKEAGYYVPRGERREPGSDHDDENAEQ